MKKNLVTVFLFVFVLVFAGFSSESLAQQVGACGERSAVRDALAGEGEITVPIHVVSVYPPPRLDACEAPSPQVVIRAGEPAMSWSLILLGKATDEIEWAWTGPNSWRYSSKATLYYDEYRCYWSYWAGGLFIPGDYSVEIFIKGISMGVKRYFKIIPQECLLKMSAHPSTVAGKITGEGIDCGKDCQEIFPQDSIEYYEVAENPGWKFVGWSDGNTDNPRRLVLSGKSASYQAIFVPDNPRVFLRPVDRDSFGTRRPLILVHDDKREDNKDCGWSKFIAQAMANADFKSKYKIYLFSYDSSKRDFEVGMALGCLYDRSSILVKKNPVFLAHGRGGNIVLNHMYSYRVYSGKYQGKPGGDRTRCLISLGTPFYGTPLVDSTWMNFSLDYIYSDGLAKRISEIYLSDSWFKKYISNSTTRKYLAWADIEDQVTDEDVCWDSSTFGADYCAPLLNNPTLKSIAGKTSYLQKIVAFGGNNYQAKRKVLDIIDNPKFSVSGQAKLDLASLLLARKRTIPNGYPTNPIVQSFCPDCANDGRTPLRSALFLKPYNYQLFFVGGEGNLIYDKEVFNSLMRTKESIILPGLVDNLDYVENLTVVKRVLSKLRSIY